MKPNGIICIDFTEFDSVESLIEWINQKENIRYKKLYLNKTKDRELCYQKAFSLYTKIWIIDDFVLFLKERRDTKGVLMISDAIDFIDSNSIEITDPKPIIKKSPVVLDVDSILDRINEVGLNGITKEEKEFLQKNS